MPDPARPLPAGPELIHALERVLGIGVLIQSIDDEPSFTIRAVLLLGPHSQEVVALGQTEADAWREFARIATAWRTTNDKQVPFWPGGGGL